MIALLRGRIVELADDHVVIDTGGVGYEVFCHLRTLASLHEERDREVTLRVHTAVSDDAIRLFGFATGDELRLFRLLIGVERIGPKAALGILGRAELPVMVRAIRRGDAALVATVPGIGRKTAERVILELRDKLDSLTTMEDVQREPAPRGAVVAAVEGLVGLGFREPEARAAVNAAAAADGEDLGVAELVGAALRRLDAAAGPAR
jgi:holliday junction DNA helicase RuvA